MGKLSADQLSVWRGASRTLAIPLQGSRLAGPDRQRRGLPQRRLGATGGGIWRRWAARSQPLLSLRLHLSRSGAARGWDAINGPTTPWRTRPSGLARPSLRGSSGCTRFARSQPQPYGMPPLSRQSAVRVTGRRCSPRGEDARDGQGLRSRVAGLCLRFSQETKRAHSLCVSAAGSKKFCGGRRCSSHSSSCCTHVAAERRPLSLHPRWSPRLDQGLWQSQLAKEDGLHALAAKPGWAAPTLATSLGLLRLPLRRNPGGLSRAHAEAATLYRLAAQLSAHALVETYEGHRREGDPEGVSYLVAVSQVILGDIETARQGLKEKLPSSLRP